MLTQEQQKIVGSIADDLNRLAQVYRESERKLSKLNKCVCGNLSKTEYCSYSCHQEDWGYND